MSLNWRQFELGVLRPTLAGEPEVAIKLVGETIWHESDRLQALGQYVAIDPNNPMLSPFGPGLGIASIEEPTWDWMVKESERWVNTKFYLGYRDYEDLAWDLRLNVLACRIRYKLDRRPLPADTLEARADYWFRVYNASGVESRKAKYIADAKLIPWVR